MALVLVPKTLLAEAKQADLDNAKRHREKQALHDSKRSSRKTRAAIKKLKKALKNKPDPARMAALEGRQTERQIIAALERMALRCQTDLIPYKRGLPAQEFVLTREWMKLRFAAFRRYGRTCLCCGAKRSDDILHVDHVKPRSKYPDLELDITNLQVLCRSCNIGKAADSEEDFRNTTEGAWPAPG